MRSKNPEYFTIIENFVDAYRDDSGNAPTIYEIADGTGISKSTVSRYLSYMRDNGMIDYTGRRSIVTKKTRKMKGETISVPVLGAVSCGIPKYAEENIEEYVMLPVAIFGRGEFYFLRASGDSMILAGIHDGDLVLIRKQNDAKPGEIVVAIMEDEATIKRYFPEPEFCRVRLHPENNSLSDIFVDSCVIQGVAVKVLNDLL